LLAAKRMSKRKPDDALLDGRFVTAKKQKTAEIINYFEVKLILRYLIYLFPIANAKILITKSILTEFSFSKCLPDSTLAYIFSLLPPIENPYESWAKYLRGISRQFCRVWDEIEPCFAFMKMIQREYQRVQESGGTIQSPWFTEYETSFLTSRGVNFDLRDPLPAPELIPLTAVQIIAATLYSQSKLAYHHPKNTRLVYAARCTATFISPVINELSKFNGKEVIFQETVSYQCPYADTSSQVLEVNQTLFIPDPEFAAYAGVPPYAPIDR
jgi:hypothetical protein